MHQADRPNPLGDMGPALYEPIQRQGTRNPTGGDGCMNGELRTKPFNSHQDLYDRIKNKQKRGYGKQCKKKYFNNIYWITLCIIYDLFQNVMNNIK